MFARALCFGIFSCFYFYCLLLLPPLASAAAVSAAAAAAAAVATALLLYYCRLVLLGVFFSLPILWRKVYVMGVVQNSQKSSGYEY